MAPAAIPARVTALAAAVAVLLTAVVLLMPGTARAATSCTPDPVLCPARLYVGASVPGLPTNSAATDAFTAATGISPSVAMYFAGFGDQVDTAALRRLADAGRLPMMTWEPFDASNPTANPYPLQQIAAGAYDGYLRAQGAALAAVGKPVAVRFGHEMNGNWYPWGQHVNGNTAADYVAAYRHVHDVLVAAGATNAIWVWSPNLIDFDPTQDLAPLYPGDGYVDWVGLSAYMDNPADTYAQMFPSTLTQLDRIAPTKPIYVAETAVLPGATRPAMITDLVSGLLATPRLVGFTWFDHVTRFDWRIENDPAAAAALADALTSPYFGAAGHVNDPVLLAPVAMGVPWITGTAQAGQTLASSTGSWRSPAGSGPLTLTRRWYRCTTPTDPGTCAATAATNGGYGLSQWDANKFMRVAVTATNDVGSTVAWSGATPAVLMTPAPPAPPTVQAYSGALHVIFPPTVPFGATHWKLTVGGAAKPLIPVTTTDYWLTGLTNGVSYDLTLAAVDASQTGSLASAPTTGTGVPLTAPWQPYLQVTDTTVTAKMPPTAPTGATGWRFTVGSVARDLPLGAAPTQITGLLPGQPVSWTLQAVAGSWGGQPGLSQPAKGSFTPVDTSRLAAPTAPSVEARDGALHVIFPPVPANATHWQLSIDGVAKPLIPATTSDYWLTGLTNGRSYQLTLAGAIVTSTASGVGPATSGTGVPMTAPWNPTVTVTGTTATVTLPANVPAGATGWRLTVGSSARDLPLGSAPAQVTGLTAGQPTTWTLQAVAGSWAGQPGTARTPPVTGSVTPIATTSIPAAPAAPTVEARDGALHVLFPPAPANATHWQLTVGGVLKPLIPVSSTDYWLTGLTDGTSYDLALAAVAVNGTASATGPSATGSAVPMTAPRNPTVAVTGTTATVTLPGSAPAGATGWQVTVGTTTRILSPTTSATQFTDLTPGQVTPWSLRAVAGTWAGQPGTAMTPPVTGAVTPVDTSSIPAPAAPAVEARDGSLHVLFPPVPANATHWQLTVDGVLKPLIPATTKDYWLTGLTNGHSYALTLAGAIVTSTASGVGPATTGTAVPMTAPANLYAKVTGTTAVFTLPKAAPTGAAGWTLSVDGNTTTLALGTATSTVTGLTTGVAHTWALQATDGSWGLTPAATGSFTPLDTPAAPQVATDGSGGATFTFPTVPAGAVGWQLTVGPTSQPQVAAGTLSQTVTGLKVGYPTGWTLRAVAATSTQLVQSATVTGTLTP